VASALVSRWTKAEAFLVCLLPLTALGWRAWKQDLGANPIELITHATGDWALRFLLIALAVTPASNILSMPRFTLFRRMLEKLRKRLPQFRCLVVASRPVMRWHGARGYVNRALIEEHLGQISDLLRLRAGPASWRR